jgi:hypothetical protein
VHLVEPGAVDGLVSERPQVDEDRRQHLGELLVQRLGVTPAVVLLRVEQMAEAARASGR